MRIKKIETLRWPELPRIVVARVEDEGGLVGLGESVDKVSGTEAAIHGTLAPLVLGQEADDIEGIWRFVMDNIMYHGYAGAEVRALSAVEIALWDLLGKRLGAPLYQLLGGKCRDRVPTYNTCIGTPALPDYEAWHHNPDDLAVSLLSDGINRMKIWPFDRFSEASGGHYISPGEIEEGLTPIRKIRDRVGLDMEIGIEMHFRWSRGAAERITRALEPYSILFVEDPIAAVHPAEIKELSRSTSIPLVGSELLMTRWQYRDWLAAGTTQMVMTDPLWNGGIAETRRIANLAEAYGTPVVLHNVASPICHAACMHLGAHLPNLVFSESVRAFYRTYFRTMSGWEPTVDRGTLDIPEGPGLGVELLPEMLDRPDALRRVSEGPGKAEGRRAMGDHWAVEEIR